MNELIQNIMDAVNKKGIQSNCRKILKKCSMKSARDTGLITELAIWLYVYDYKREAVSVCDLLKNEKFDGNYTLWDNIDHTRCLKARILREQGDLNESKKIIEFVNQYRNPELYKNGVDWFLKTLDINIESNLNANCKARAKSWRLLKLELAIAYREAGKYPVSDDDLEIIIKELKDLLSKEK
nr:DUF6707 family protein [uncultured Mediterraneibacter sp.]